MRYHGFIPLTDCGSNGRKIHNDYGEYWGDYEEEDDEDEEEEEREEEEYAEESWQGGINNIIIL